MSKQLAEMAAQQAALREMAKKRAQELNEDGSGSGGEMKKIAEEKAELETELAKVKETLGEELEKNREMNEEKERALADLNKEMVKVTQEKEHFRDQITRLVKDHTMGEEKLASSEARTTGNV